VGPDATLDAGTEAAADTGVDSESPDTGADAGHDASVDSGTDAAGDAGLDAGHDAGVESGTDATADASDDAGLDAGHDAGGTDAPPDGPCTLTSCGAKSVCIAGMCTPAYRVFVSSSTHDGTFGGAAGATAICGTLATTAGIGGAWRAWVSDNTTSPSAGFSQGAIDYRMLDGTVVATSWTAVVSGALSHAIDLDETGKAFTGATGVWTNTNTNGTPVTTTGNDCTNFTSNAGSGVAGDCTSTSASWTFQAPGFCSPSLHLYCFEQ
jgi:hypothetical protein